MNDLPFLLRYEELPDGDSVTDGLDNDYYDDADKGGVSVRSFFVPWDIFATLKSPEV